MIADIGRSIKVSTRASYLPESEVAAELLFNAHVLPLAPAIRFMWGAAF